MGSEPKKSSLVREGLCQLAAGGCAGAVEVSLMHPLDLVKTRFQKTKSSIVGTFGEIIRSEGLPSLYKGYLPAILQDAPKRATKFFTFEQYKALFSAEKNKPSAIALAMAGFCSGLTEAFIITPFEVVKVRLQTETVVSLKHQKSAFTVAREIAAEYGFGTRGLYKGLTATMGRHGVFGGVYFGFYHNVKDMLPMCEDPWREFLRKFSIGLAAGTLASCSNIPFDVAKSRIQGPQPVPGEIKYRTCFASIATVAKEEGVTALYRGLVPKVLRLGPGGAIMLLLYEYAFGYLEKKFL